MNELRVSIPSEISLLGFDDMMFTQVFRPKLTIVDQPIAKIAETTVARIFELLQQESFDYKVNVLECDLIINDSTAPYSKA